MKRIIVSLFMLMCLGVITITAQTMTFTHPGAIHSQEELLFVKAKIAAGEQPWAGQYTHLLNWAIAGTATIPALTADGTGENGQKVQAQRAYANALAYWYSGNANYANQAIAIVKAWALVQPYKTYYSQDMLDCAWMGTLLGPTADLLRNYMSVADLTTITTMFKTVFIPSLIVRDVSNGNRDLEQIDAMFSISVFCEDQ